MRLSDINADSILPDLTIDIKLTNSCDATKYDCGPGIINTYEVSLKYNEQTISSTTLTTLNGIGYTSDLKTVNQYQGKGFASTLYKKLIDIARNLNLKELRSDTNRKEQTSKIWKKIGAELYNDEHGQVFRLKL